MFKQMSELDNDFELNSAKLNKVLYREVRYKFSLKSQLEWLFKPVLFRRPQCDLVRDRDYSFVENSSLLSIWYLHIPVTKNFEEFDRGKIQHVVGIDRGLRFLAVTYDEHGKTGFKRGKQILSKRHKFFKVRQQLQAKGTKSAKRALVRLSGRENRWMSDINHCLSKTLALKYGSNTLFVLEDLTGISFEESNLNRGSKSNNDLRSWAFYQLEQFLAYKAHAICSEVLKVSARYTGQRCPKCGNINKANRHHHTHEYICQCGYRSNDDRIGAMNIQLLGTLWISGEDKPHFEKITTLG